MHAHFHSTESVPMAAAILLQALLRDFPASVPDDTYYSFIGSFQPLRAPLALCTT